MIVIAVHALFIRSLWSVSFFFLMKNNYISNNCCFLVIKKLTKMHQKNIKQHNCFQH